MVAQRARPWPTPLGPIDILVNNAGMAATRGLDDILCVRARTCHDNSRLAGDVWADLRRAPELVVAWATVYLVGQVALWWRMSRPAPRQPSSQVS